MNDGASDISGDVNSSVSSDDEDFIEDYTEERFISDLPRVRDNDPNITALGGGLNDFIDNITNEEWEEIGRDISNNTHLKKLELYGCALDDDKSSYLFRGLTASSSLKKLALDGNGHSLGMIGVRSMIPFLQNATNLRFLDLDNNNLQSEGFNLLLRALRDSPIEKLDCNGCGIGSIEIDTDNFPRSLTQLHLESNNINADGCREITKLLQGGDSTLTRLMLNSSVIDDECVAILTNALRSNTSLKVLGLWGNITKQGLVMLLKLVNDISSIKATLQSNHTLKDIIGFHDYTELRHYISMATEINDNHSGHPEAVAREKVIQTQLDSGTRAELTELQGVRRSVYSEINPLHLPEVLSLVGREHGQEELYVALRSSIAGLMSTVDRRQYLEQQIAYYATKLAQHRAELMEIDVAAGAAICKVCGNKRPRSQ